MNENTALMERTERLDSPIYGEIVPIAAIQQNIARVQAAKASVMKKGLHYGVIPGTEKDTLYKAGAELINLMFGVACDPDPADLRESEGRDEAGLPFYRCTVRMVFTLRATKLFLGASYGYASSLEEKYKWRRATGPKEFEATPEGRKRVKFRRGKAGSEYEELQVRTETEDIKNTVLQIAMKRAEVSGTKRVHALSDMFGQDLEDMPEEIRDSIVDGEVVAHDEDRKPVQPGQRKSQQSGNGQTAGTGRSAPASRQEPPSTTGTIVSVDDKKTQNGKTYYRVTLSSGFVCSTWSASLAEEARKQVNGPVVTLATEQPDPKFPPTLKGIALASTATPASREPGEEG